MCAESVDVYLVGTGMVGYQQLTRECEQALDSVERIYLLHPLPEVREYVREQWGSVVDLTEEYEQGGPRQQSYERMAERVLDGAEETDGPVALAAYGHPTVAVSPSTVINERGEQRGLSIEVLPGISSLDCLYTDLILNPLSRGLQLFEATDLLVYETGLNPGVPALILQIGLVGTRLYDQRASAPGRFTPIKDHLSTFYPADHELKLVRTATLPFADPEIIEFTLAEFESVADQVDPTHTLYVPPASERTVVNETFAEKSRSRAYLDEITEE